MGLVAHSACFALASIVFASAVFQPQTGTPAVIAVSGCRTAQLRATLGGQNSGVGSIFTTIVLRNVGRQSCSVTGYPGISLVDGARRQIGRPARWDAGVVRWFTLRPGEAASTAVHSLNPGTGTTNCLPPSTALRVYPPNARTALLVPARLSDCLGTLGVTPLVPGTNGL